MRSPTVQDSDLSARTKIREAALSLFATEGFAVSVRAIANAAGCSPGLVVHHFGNKDGLQEAVDQSVMDTLLQRFGGIPKELPADELSRSMGDAFSDVIGASPVVRQYIRRSLLEGTPASQTIFDKLLALTNASLGQLQRAGGLRESLDPQWRPYQLLFVILGTLLLEPAIQSHFDRSVYEPDLRRERTAANYDLLSHGMFLGSTDAARSQP
jgi:TetR/AcrR family transcriptional regulator, regulator of cefoperazone and chloramphenicol sensitivity